MFTTGLFRPVWAESPDEDYLAIFTALNQNYIRLVAAGDVDGLMKYYASDAIQMLPGTPTIYGADKIRKSWEDYFADFEVLEATSFIDSVEVTGDRAFAIGHYTSTARSKVDGTIYHESGRFADGTWIIVVEMVNYDQDVEIED
jgi:ketosteroid isomerase-like protein